MAAHVLEGEVLAEVEVAEQADLRLVEHLVQRGDDALDPRVIRATPYRIRPNGAGIFSKRSMLTPGSFASSDFMSASAA
ncbi:hypothetical protein MTP03_04410 [Tsukamurella sp. PLM1]|nr:hypothetical protein MTP03_04410 [Tsukamurella sp. PLM1]